MYKLVPSDQVPPFRAWRGAALDGDHAIHTPPQTLGYPHNAALNTLQTTLSLCTYPAIPSRIRTRSEGCAELLSPSPCPRQRLVSMLSCPSHAYTYRALTSTYLDCLQCALSNQIPSLIANTRKRPATPALEVRSLPRSHRPCGLTRRIPRRFPTRSAYRATLMRPHRILQRTSLLAVGLATNEEERDAVKHTVIR
jgi:hypothetical protein